jgi:hypothetical protein
MAQRIIGIRVAITRYVSDEPQPGIIECEFTDAFGRQRRFVEKTAIVSAEDLDARTRYPQPGVIACEVLEFGRDASGRDIILVSTEYPDSVEAVDGTMRFEVLPTALVEWECGSKVERPWDGRTEPRLCS